MNDTTTSSNTSNTYYNGNKGSRYIPKCNDMHFVSHGDLTKNNWMYFGCIKCIKEQKNYDVLEKPIDITVQRNGFGSIIRGQCSEGHCFSMGKQFENKKR